MTQIVPTPRPTSVPGKGTAPYLSPLWDRARAAGIEGRSGLTEAELARLLEG